MCHTCPNFQALPQEDDQPVQELYDKVKLVRGEWLCVDCFQKPECYMNFAYCNYRLDRSTSAYYADIHILNEKEVESMVENKQIKVSKKEEESNRNAPLETPLPKSPITSAGQHC